jgi:hypothetical protein
MKNLILFIVLFIPFSLFAQDNVSTATLNDQTDLWMTKISSDSEMRVKMMDLMIEKTNGNEEEMMKLVNPMLSDTEMHKMIFATNTDKAAENNNDNISIEPREMMSGSGKVGKVLNTEPNSSKK